MTIRRVDFRKCRRETQLFYSMSMDNQNASRAAGFRSKKKKQKNHAVVLSDSGSAPGVYYTSFCSMIKIDSMLTIADALFTTDSERALSLSLSLSSLAREKCVVQENKLHSI